MSDVGSVESPRRRYRLGTWLVAMAVVGGAGYWLFTRVEQVRESAARMR